MKKCGLIPWVTCCFLLCVQTATSAIILTFSPGNGNLVNWRMSGSGVIAAAVPSDSTNRVFLPMDAGNWVDLNDAFFDGVTDGAGAWKSTGTNLTYPTSGTWMANLGGADLTVLGNPVMPLSWRDRGSSGHIIGNDGTAGAFDYPAGSPGDVFQWSGSGTLDLGTDTFDDRFNRGIHASALGNGMQFQLHVIPEPSSWSLLGVLMIAGLVIRRIKLGATE